MSTAVYLFSLSQEELHNIIQNQDRQLFRRLAYSRSEEEWYGTTTDIFSKGFFDLTENHPLFQLLYTESVKHEVLTPMANHLNTRVLDHDAISKIIGMWEPYCLESEVIRYCEKHGLDCDDDEDYTTFRRIVWDISMILYRAKEEGRIVVFFSE